MVFNVGLQLTLAVSEYEYRDLATCDTAGIRVVVLNQNLMPFPEDIGLTVSPRQYSTIGVIKVNMFKATSIIFKCFLYKNENRQL